MALGLPPIDHLQAQYVGQAPLREHFEVRKVRTACRANRMLAASAHGECRRAGERRLESITRQHLGWRVAGILASSGFSQAMPKGVAIRRAGRLGHNDALTDTRPTSMFVRWTSAVVRSRYARALA
jgi:hypothetical protein